MAVCFNPKPTTYMPDRPPGIKSSPSLLFLSNHTNGKSWFDEFYTVLDPFLAVKNLGLKCLSRADSSVSCNPTTT
ncbi:hypothetical protein ERO13_A13G049300v2 [Gossypium hirsutum]|uniref:Uncharacterized protein n=3 Tax=Gossypium TaxID=3633 RepID=A0A5J5SVA2_GOSBA|nr:hypothetical protein ES319_A13G051600v1 [Gossypium barbadense]KAG4164956.1 hypothetical protein ERO13_A13G049300v2 [Gossypium hirsutum]TYH90538.1 hypothetical protein ES332_A13G055200v1 [Gossypium tomentosum]TYI99935.1 hypothetical protein E1A91_A13G052600v1 [Gossypium mustelinum]